MLHSSVFDIQFFVLIYFDNLTFLLYFTEAEPDNLDYKQAFIILKAFHYTCEITYLLFFSISRSHGMSLWSIFLYHRALLPMKMFSKDFFLFLYPIASIMVNH